jgi:hypothetical protein
VVTTTAAELVDDAVSELVDDADEVAEALLEVGDAVVDGADVAGVALPGGGVTTPESSAGPKSWLVGYPSPGNAVLGVRMVTIKLPSPLIDQSNTSVSGGRIHVAFANPSGSSTPRLPGTGMMVGATHESTATPKSCEVGWSLPGNTVLGARIWTTK